MINLIKPYFKDKDQQQHIFKNEYTSTFRLLSKKDGSDI